VKDSLRKQFGNTVKALRLSSGISQEAFADKCGFARSYMSRIERGTANPSLDAIEMLADALEIEVKVLFETAASLGTSIKPVEPVAVPFAADGSYFNPSLRRKRTGKFTVGEKGTEVAFDTFEGAVEYLKEMEPASWRRPNNGGNWGRVVAVRWGSLPKKY
jgi:transcriptional regulator with XRE-family HTH domain